MERRLFLKSSSAALASFGLMAASPSFLHEFAANAQSLKNSNGRRKVLVTIFQRGAMDGLNAVVPYGESEYYNLRRTIAVPKPNQTNGAIDLDGFFGLNPALKPFESLWKEKRLAIVNAAGSPDNTRSHFDAQDYMEAGTPGVKSTRDGWLNRILQNTDGKNDSPFRAVAFAKQMPRSLMGRAPSVALTNIQDFAIKAGNYTASVEGGFEKVYAQTVDEVLGATGKETFEAINLLKDSSPTQYKPANGAFYPNSQLGNSLRQIAQLIKAGVGLEIAFAESNGWDTHANEGSSRGQIANLLRDFSASIAAFVTDLGKERMDDVVILTMSEFGRTARENGTRGTDHGHANAMFVIGNSVKGGKVYGNWKGLSPDKLYEGRDLDVTTDFRDVFGEVAARHFGAKDLSKLFPGYAANGSKFKGFLG
ncbi:MAG: DUF1501 domain-containing protein [Acidobacteriota bacterium]|nr:DUF1501 domain-containing protein [Acidobacteriota bacterium]